MDGQRFDEMTRALATGTSRRRVLKGLTGGVLGTLAGALGVSRVGAGHGRPNGATCIRNEHCASGYCDPQTRRCACPEGTTACGDACVGTTCPAGAVLDPTSCTCVCTATGQAPCGTGTAATCACEVAYGEACDQNTDCQAGSVCRPPDTRFDQTCTTTGPGGACCLNTAVAGGPCDEAADCRGFGENDPCRAVTCEGGVCVVRGAVLHRPGRQRDLLQHQPDPGLLRGVCCPVGQSCVGRTCQ